MIRIVDRMERIVDRETPCFNRRKWMGSWDFPIEVATNGEHRIPSGFGIEGASRVSPIESVVWVDREIGLVVSAC